MTPIEVPLEIIRLLVRSRSLVPTARMLFEVGLASSVGKTYRQLRGMKDLQGMDKYSFPVMEEILEFGTLFLSIREDGVVNLWPIQMEKHLTNNLP